MFKPNNFQIDEYFLTFTTAIIITVLLQLLLSFNFQYERKMILTDKRKILILKNGKKIELFCDHFS